MKSALEFAGIFIQTQLQDKITSSIHSIEHGSMGYIHKHTAGNTNIIQQ